MKVLQTLGRHSGAQSGIFQYRREVGGVRIDSAVGQAVLTPSSVMLTHGEWLSILESIKNAQQSSFRLTGTQPFSAPPNQSLYELISNAVPSPANGWQWTDSWKSYVCAILEHEGTVDLYHGTLGPSHQAIITLSRDI